MTYYLKIDEVLAIHDGILKTTGGREGVFSFILLHSAVERSKATFSGQDLYQTLFEKAAALIHSLIQNHPFNDGNKRTALAATARFLFLNGYELRHPVEKTVEFTVKIQKKKISFGETALWIKSHAKKTKF